MKIRSSRAREHGAALVIVLCFLTMIALLIVGQVNSMRVDRLAAHSYLEKTRASLFSQMAVENTIALLQQATSDTSRFWITQPGQLFAGSASLQDLSPVPLHSGVPTYSGTDGSLRPPNLNIATFSNPSRHLITDALDAGGVVKMPVKWIYVRQDGTLVPDEIPDLTLSGNPIVGRYAYWVDDESSRINANLAWSKNAAVSAGHPSKVDLTALPGVTPSLADEIHASVTAKGDYSDTAIHVFNTPLDIKRVSADVGSVMEANKFEITNYNQDPNLSILGEPRIVLTTSPKRAGWTKINGVWTAPNGKTGKDGRPYYIRILAGDEDPAKTDPGLVVNFNKTAITETVAFLTDQLNRKDWPTAPGSSFQTKYFPGNPVSVTQLALDIIEYVRAKESPSSCVESLRGNMSTGSFVSTDNTANRFAFIGTARRPLITEVGFWFGEIGAKGGTLICQMEVYLPSNYGISEIDLGSASDRWATRYQMELSNGEQIITTLDTQGKLVRDETQPSNPLILKAGGYATIRHTITIPAEKKSPYTDRPYTTRPTSLRFRAIFQNNGNVLDSIPMDNANRMSYIVDPYTGPANAGIIPVTSIEVDDPRVNRNMACWVQHPTNSPPSHTFGGQNTRWTGGQKAANHTPQQDTDLNGNTSLASFYMPPPAGRIFTRADGTPDNNTAGVVGSAGELGNICTGVDTAGPGTPWRTLRLQPSNAGSNVVPDWALMDLFTPPVGVHANAQYIYQRHGNSVGGRVNMNAKPAPFADIQRITPLAAVLQGCTYDSTLPAATLDAADTATVAGYIYNKMQASTPAGEGKLFDPEIGYIAPGEIVEVKGIADRGEASEELVRQISNLLTTRGEVFNIYAVGQAVKQTRGEKLQITGEQRSQTVVERYVDTGVTPSAVRFKTLLTHPLTP